MEESDLFSNQADREKRHAPLADRMRPVSLDQFVGQGDLLGPDRFLRRAIESDRIPSVVLWGPPGCGKTALASVIARSTGAAYVPFSAVLGGVREIREIAKQAARDRDMHRRRTILFIDEIHRLNKAQQDALLPHVERGTFTLIGATTENPSFEVNAALLSRCRVCVLKPLAEEDLRRVLQRALDDRENGLGGMGLQIADGGMQALVAQSRGDARRALNTLEAAAAHLRARGEGSNLVGKEVVAEAAQHGSLLYDRAGDEHYNTVSAFIKSLRGSDPDAAVYWMTRMLEAGEDPRFLLRRMIIFASEDIGNADPQAIQVATACLAAHEFVGLPESALNLSQLATYLAAAPKSNASLTAYIRARKDIRDQGALPVPLHLRNAPTNLMRDLDYGKEYRYPHDFEGNYVVENYLPDALRHRVYYTPSENGHEAEIKKRLSTWRNKGEETP